MLPLPSSIAVSRLFFVFGCASLAVAQSEPSLGIFAGRTDIGSVSRPGTLTHDRAKGTYAIGASGANMWGTRDDLHFVWREAEGDVALSADIAFVGASSEPHRKACILIRQSLEPGAVYADAAFHGDGLTSLQFREEHNGITREVQANVSAPQRLRLEKIDDWIYLSLAGKDGIMRPAGCSVQLPALTGKFYVGLGVCAHDNKAFETALFSNVVIGPPNGEARKVRSSIETIVLASTDRRSVFHSTARLGASHWSPDGAALLFNEDGRIFRLPLANDADAKPAAVDTGFATRCINHGLSPDGAQLAFTDQSKDGRPRIYLVPARGGTPREVTPEAPAIWRGWSPDGRTLIFTAEREGKRGLFTVPVSGGAETRLTTAPREVEDHPAYSRDGQWIYFASDRSGRVQIWRMRADGSAMEQVTHDDHANAFPQPSPDGRWVAFLSFERHTAGAPAEQNLLLRAVSTTTAAPPRFLAKIHGGSGTLAAPAWSPDSTKLTYVRYQPAPAR